PRRRGRSEFPDHPEADPGVGGVARRRRAPGRPGLLRRAGPGTAADHVDPAARVDPGGGIARGAAVAIVPAVGHPFADVARKIVQAPFVRRERGYRRRAPVAVAIAFEGVAPAASAPRPVAR